MNGCRFSIERDDQLIGLNDAARHSTSQRSAMNASNNPTLLHAKPEPRKRAKGRRQRVEIAVVKTVRAQVKDRDGYCRLYGVQAPLAFGPCAGPSEWAHVGGRV